MFLRWGFLHKGTASQEAKDRKSGGEGMWSGRSSSFFPRGFNADRKLCASLSVFTEWKWWPYPDLWDLCLYTCNTNIYPYVIIRRPSWIGRQTVRRGEVMRRGGKGSFINSLGFWDLSRERSNPYPYKSKIVWYSCTDDPYIKEQLLKKTEIKRAVEKGYEVAEVKLFPEGFNTDRKLCTFLSVFTAWKWWPYPAARPTPHYI